MTATTPTATPTAATPTPEELAARVGWPHESGMRLCGEKDIAAAIRQHSEALRAEIERLTKENARLGWGLAYAEEGRDDFKARATTAEAALAKVTAEREKDEAVALQLIDQRDTAENALGKLFAMLTGRPPEWSNLFGYSEALDECEEALTASQERERGMREALNLAANRLSRCAIDHPAGSREMSERSEWADEARNLLQPQETADER